MTFYDVIQYLFYAIVAIVQYFREFFKGREYYIRKVSLQYDRDGEKDVTDVTVEYKYYGGAKAVLKGTSKDVSDLCFAISYLYKLKPYMYLTRNPDHVFPPLKRSASFKVPVKEAFTLDENDAPIHNVTDTVKLYEGPNVDFHGEDILLCDMNIGVFSKLRLVNILGAVVEIEDRINHQTLWSQDKT